MRPIYFKKDYGTFSTKFMADMAWLVTHKEFRMLKHLFEEGIYLLHTPKKNDTSVEKYFLTRDKIIKEDDFHYFFDFPFKPEQVAGIAI